MTDMTTDDAAGLLPCPFCGAMPMTLGSGEGRRGLMIECATPGCVQPHVSYYEHEASIAAWNTRSQVPPEPVGERQSGIDAGLAMGAEIAEHLRIAIAAHDAHFGKSGFVGHWTNLARAALAARTERGEDNPNGR